MCKDSYDSRLAEWESDQDQWYFTTRFLEAADNCDYSMIEKLIEEATIFDYKIPVISDNEVLKLLKKHGLEQMSL